MRNLVSRIVCLVALVWIAGVTGLHAQTASTTATAVQTASGEVTAVQQTPLTPAVLTPVPRVIWFNGNFRPADKRPVASVETVTVAVYREREGGDAVWQETQIVTMEADGRYSLLMGSTLSDGMPLDVFTSGEPRWIGITVHRSGEAEQPRVHLASVPYALKAADTETLGGKPASAYLLAEQKTPHPSKNSTDAAVPQTAGTAGYVGVFVDAANLGNSALYQSGVAIGLGTTVPRDRFHVAFTNSDGGVTGYAVQNLSSAVNAYSGMLFFDQNGALGQFQGFNNTTHEYRINNVASGGAINFMIGSSSKLLVANNGNIGLGVAVPGSRLDVAGAVNAATQYNLGGTRILSAGGIFSTNVGFNAGNNSDPSSLGNSFFGAGAGVLNTTGSLNMFLGYFSGPSNTVESNNTFVGALSDVPGGGGVTNATAIGFRAKVTQSNSLVLGSINAVNGATADTNVGIGTTAPASKLDVAGDINLTGTLKVRGNTILRAPVNDSSTGLGFGALGAATPGDFNTAHGHLALNAATGGQNTGIGGYALFSTLTGIENTGVGFFALGDNTAGSANTAIGQAALAFNATGSGNIAVGYRAGSSISSASSDNILIGASGNFGDNRTIRLGSPNTHTRSFIAGVSGVATNNDDDAVPVLIDSDGQLGTIISSRRFKEDIHDMGDASRGLMRLRPVTFRYKAPFGDGSKPVQYGLIAEEVAEVYPDLVAHSADGQIQTVKYQVLDAMLLNEVQQLHAQLRAVVQQNQDIQQQNKALQQRLAALETALAGR